MSETAAQPISIDVVSDAVCPWCFVGKRKLDVALKIIELPVEVNWRPYQLDPTIPVVGIHFNFDKIQRSPNTLDAHRLIRWSQSSGRQTDVVDRLFNLYFVEGEDIGDRDLLAKVAGEHGMDADGVLRGLNSDTDKQSVIDEIATAQRIGVSGVPFFIFANKLAVSGAQPPEVLVSAVQQAAEKVAGG